MSSMHDASIYSVGVRGNTNVMSDDERSRTHVPDADPDRFQWDWVTFVVALIIAVILAVVTFEFWVSHDNLPHR